MIISRISNAQEADTDDLGKAIEVVMEKAEDIEVVMEKAEDIDPVLTVKMHGDNVIVFAEAKEGRSRTTYWPTTQRWQI